jgi:iron-sulfur cluster repair protein YtfE (RIC family)
VTICTLDSSTVDWVVEHPETTALLEALEIDYTCAGKSLAFECRRRGLDPAFVLSQLHRVIDAGTDRQARTGP